MDKYAPKFSKVLVTPDPHYVPGYTGYCPQLKYNMGRTYSQQTAELLTSPDVKRSGRLVLRTGHDPSSACTPDTAALTPRGVSDGTMKRVIPGYTGFIPRNRNHFSCSYSETCRKALSEFYQEMYARSLRRSTLLPNVNCTDRQFERPKPPLTAITDRVITYKPLVSFTHTSPYYMEDDDQHKYFISGFTGHVPKTRFLIGKGYPIITNQALVKFGKHQRSDPSSQESTGRKDITTPPLPSIYPPNSGVVPFFTGHIPGHKFLFGHTFGQLSKEALEKSRSERILQEKP
ncbi:hypothetical protein JOB18_043731 [Solea senegalensis]|uniref:Ciliary microtubule inner protein 2B n=1 Tax=Solea senegalensis TaxID=28829 RepID=A0AAV6R562_SOLSE|nr:hypothetical protein JOB18_043731 [Solea senegalensis]